MPAGPPAYGSSPKVVRMVLVPATMELLGDRNWWLPGWLGRVLPRVTVEASAQPEPSPSPRTPVATGGECQ